VVTAAATRPPEIVTIAPAIGFSVGLKTVPTMFACTVGRHYSLRPRTLVGGDRGGYGAVARSDARQRVIAAFIRSHRSTTLEDTVVVGLGHSSSFPPSTVKSLPSPGVWPDK